MVGCRLSNGLNGEILAQSCYLNRRRVGVERVIFRNQNPISPINGSAVFGLIMVVFRYSKKVHMRLRRAIRLVRGSAPIGKERMRMKQTVKHPLCSNRKIVAKKEHDECDQSQGSFHTGYSYKCSTHTRHSP